MGILQYIWKREDIEKVKKLDMFLKLAREDRSLKNVAYALRTFAEATSAKVPIFDVDYAEKWWEANRQDFVTP